MSSMMTGPSDPHEQLLAAGSLQSERLTAVATVPEDATAAMEPILRAHDGDGHVGRGTAVLVEPIARGEGAAAELVLAVRGRLLVFDRDTRTALELLNAAGLAATSGDLVTRQVRLLLLGPSDDPARSDRMLAALELLEDNGVEVSFDYVLLHNSADVTAKDAAPAVLIRDYRPPIPRRSRWRIPAVPGCPYLTDLLVRLLRARRRGVTVVCIDSGIDQEHDDPTRGRTDGWLEGVRGEVDPVTGGVDPDAELPSGAGHGTAVVGVMRLVTADVDIHVDQVSFGSAGSEAEIADAITRAGRSADVINLSCGTTGLNGHPPIAMADAIADLPRRVVVVASAGNSGSRVPHYPAAFKRVIAVAATGLDGSPAPYSSRGPWVDFSTCGTAITSFVNGTVVSTAVGGQTYRQRFEGRNPTAAVTGTSFAAPAVAARLADLRARGLSPSAAVAALRAEGRPGTDFGVSVRILEQ
jgi:hypothetical protein